MTSKGLGSAQQAFVGYSIRATGYADDPALRGGLPTRQSTLNLPERTCPERIIATNRFDRYVRNTLGEVGLENGYRLKRRLNPAKKRMMYTARVNAPRAIRWFNQTPINVPNTIAGASAKLNGRVAGSMTS